MKRCQTCHKFYGESSPVKVGDQVAFTFTKHAGRRKQICSRVGRLFLIKDDGFSVMYRGTVYHADADEVALPSEPTPLALEIFGVCEFEGDHK